MALPWRFGARPLASVPVWLGLSSGWFGVLCPGTCPAPALAADGAVGWSVAGVGRAGGWFWSAVGGSGMKALHPGCATYCNFVMEVLAVPSAMLSRVGWRVFLMARMAAVMRMSVSVLDVGIQAKVGELWTYPMLLSRYDDVAFPVKAARCRG